MLTAISMAVFVIVCYGHFSVRTFVGIVVARETKRGICEEVGRRENGIVNRFYVGMLVSIMAVRNTKCTA